MGELVHFLRLFDSLLSCEIGIWIFEISRPTPPNAAAPVPFWARRRRLTENGPACITDPRIRTILSKKRDFSPGVNTTYYANIKIIFTEIPKAGSSNWVEALLIANGDITSNLTIIDRREVLYIAISSIITNNPQ